jgi:plasmid stability protein
MHVYGMPKMIQIRNVPDALHHSLKVRAAKAGMSLSEYLLGELRKIAERPTVDELWERISARESVTLSESAADAVRAEREARDSELGGEAPRRTSSAKKRTRSA